MVLMKLFKICLVVWFLCVGSHRSHAQQEDGKPKHHENHYHLAAFVGLTTNYKGGTGYKLGVEYEYRLTDYVGIGGTFDFTGADFDIFAFSIGADFYPFKFPLIPAVGIGAKNYERKWDPFVRLMLLYNFHLSNFSLGPMIMYDFFPNQKDIMSYGITVGYSLHD
jgi:hypothetical protein